MRLTLVLRVFLIAMTLCPGFGPAQAADSGWLIGHWQGHSTKKPGDTRVFVLDVATINANQSFVAAWAIDGKKSRGQGKIDNNAITINFNNGSSVSLFRASDGGLAGSVETKDGAPGATLVFAKLGPPAAAANAKPASGSGQTCHYRPPGVKIGGQMLEAKDGEEVDAHKGRFRCVNGKLKHLS